MSHRRALLEILVLLLLVGVGGVAVALVAELFAGRIPLPILLILQGAVILGGLSLLLFLAGQRWYDVGLLTPDSRDVVRALVLLVACIVVNLLLMLIFYRLAPEQVREHMNRLQYIASRLAGELPVMAIAATMFFVGVYEELTARGFLLSRCRTVLDGVWAPVLLSSMLFGLGHVYQGWIGVVQTTAIGAVLAVYTMRWGTVWPAILAHALLNTLSVITLAGLDSRL